jgi:crossover junction endodeoxyribonuclease RuvC
MLTSNNPARILAIDPGTREMGVAVLEGDKLIYHGVAVIKRGKTPHETLSRGRAVIRGLIDDFRPGVLVIEKTFIGKNRRLALLNVFADEIKALARRNRVAVVGFAPCTVKKAITGNGWASKEDLARAVVARYPELKAYLLHDPKWKGRFHCNMFDAVALGLLAVERERMATPTPHRRQPVITL